MLRLLEFACVLYKLIHINDLGPIFCSENSPPHWHWESVHFGNGLKSTPCRVNTFFFSDLSSHFGHKTGPNLSEDLCLFFFGPHLISDTKPFQFQGKNRSSVNLHFRNSPPIANSWYYVPAWWLQAKLFFFCCTSTLSTWLSIFFQVQQVGYHTLLEQVSVPYYTSF